MLIYRIPQTHFSIINIEVGKEVLLRAPATPLLLTKNPEINDATFFVVLLTDEWK